MKNRRNYYRILHVQPDAPLEIIKSSYRTLLLRLKKHPDLGGNHRESALLNEAKDVLFDPRKRAKYDQNLNKISASRRQSNGPTLCERIHLSAIHRVSRVFSRKGFSHTCQFCRHSKHYSAPLSPDTRCSRCNSPLYPTWKIKSSEIAKRAFQRIAQNFAITFCTEWPSPHAYHGQTSQLSPTGMQFISEKHLESGAVIKISSPHIEAVARVVYCCDNFTQANPLQKSNITGVEFLAFISQMAPGTFVSQTS